VQGRDKWALIKDADVMVQCSDSESFGMAVVESLASGVPVVATRTCPWSVLEDRECGFWVEQSAPAIVAALRTLAEDPVRRARMGERASTFAREHYSWDAAAHLMAAEYTRVLRERPH
jgi:glycosyltransferase involved in cell wall biosynthesis